MRYLLESEQTGNREELPRARHQGFCDFQPSNKETCQHVAVKANPGLAEAFSRDSVRRAAALLARSEHAAYALDKLPGDRLPWQKLCRRPPRPGLLLRRRPRLGSSCRP